MNKNIHEQRAANYKFCEIIWGTTCLAFLVTSALKIFGAVSMNWISIFLILFIPSSILYLLIILYMIITPIISLFKIVLGKE